MLAVLIDRTKASAQIAVVVLHLIDGGLDMSMILFAEPDLPK
jgi:hypothetical protein